MRIMWLSNAPWSHTGYGNQTEIFAPRINALEGVDLSIMSFYGLEGSMLTWNGIDVFPRHRHPYGMDIIDAHARRWKADVVISLMDAWVVDPMMIRPPLKWIPWFPIDSEPMPIAVERKVAQAHKRIVFSHFAEQMCHDKDLDCYYVPHGVRTDGFKPVGMAEAREALQIPQDVFLIGIVAANKGNPSRKAFTQQLDAFKMLRDKHDDVRLYLHTDPQGDSGINLPEYINHLGLTIGRDIVFAPHYDYLVGLPEDKMNLLYNAFDVHSLVSLGEGFGIPIMEAQSAGCPVIVGDWTAMGELCLSGWKVDKSEADHIWTGVAGYQYIPRVQPIYEAYEAAYRMKGNMDYRKQARSQALKYDADKITEKYWKPVLADIAESLEDKPAESVSIPVPELPEA